jgi:hypothetical protein
MAHLVKCSICGETFDRDKIQAVKTGARRYAHATCDPNNKDLVPLLIKEEDKDLKALKDCINKIYGKSANWILINKQIKDFQKDYNYSLSGILKTLLWFYEIKGNSPEKSNGGIGIVPFAYNDAFNYYYNLFVAQSQNENIDIEGYTTKVREITIPLPAIKEKKRFFNLEDDEE